METENRKKLTSLVLLAMLVLGLVFGFGLIYKIFQFNDDLSQVDGEILEKNKGPPNYTFVVKKDDGHIVKFIVDFETYYTYDVGSYYSGEIRIKDFIEGP